MTGIISLPTGTSDVMSGLEQAQRINTAFRAVVTKFAGPTAPTAAQLGLDSLANVEWTDTSATTHVVKVRNGSDNAWIVVGFVDQTAGQYSPAIYGAAITSAGSGLMTASSVIAQRELLGLSSVAYTGIAQSWTKPQRPTATDTRTVGGTVTLDFTSYQNFILTLSSALTLIAPTIDANCVGQKGAIRIIAGSYTTPGGWWAGLKRVSSDGTATMASLASLPSSGVARLDYEVISTTRVAVTYSVEEA